MSRSSDDELAETLDELAGLLEDLEGQLPARSRERRPGELPRPPGPGEFIRFTEQYTIPTLISLLEATVAVLELLRALLRLTGGRGLPDPRPGRSRGAIGETGRRAVEGLDDVLADLNDALAGQPTEPEARDLLGEARDLRAEIDDLLREGRNRSGRDRRERSDRDRSGRSRPERDEQETGGISIAVGESEDGETGGDGSEDGEGEESDAVDVEAELEALKRAREED